MDLPNGFITKTFIRGSCLKAQGTKRRSQGPSEDALEQFSLKGDGSCEEYSNRCTRGVIG